MDRANETEDLMAKIRALNGDDGGEDDSPGSRMPGSDGSFGAKRTRDGGLGTDYSSPLGKGSAGRQGGAAGSGLGGNDYSPSSFGVDGRGRRVGDSNLGKGLGGTKDHLGNLMSINDDIKAKALRLNDFRRKKDGLEAKNLRRNGIDELRSGLRQACSEYDRMAEDLEQ